MVSLNEIHENDLFITQSRVRDACADNGDMEYLKKEFAFRGGRWDGRDISPVWKASDGARILVLGDSDEEFSLGAFAALRALGRYQQIWSTHVAGNKQKFVNALPIGLPYDRHYGFPFDVIGDVSLVRKAFLTTALPAVEDMKILGSFEDRNSADRPALRTILREVRLGRVKEPPHSCRPLEIPPGHEVIWCCCLPEGEGDRYLSTLGSPLHGCTTSDLETSVYVWGAAGWLAHSLS